ncbi:phosphoserine phosphatase SerB [Desulforhopalus singaporensis]|uniref:Phosphoserine phosphatase n=1 Tax=Desulforhopalus singaporensis TaxID=91360 RepID=A0A1H0RJH4_9BACT|nr:phosphoserine phosphatase SerB [Desulforhopalus singaporensis]SDP29694.1 phosphoserine phosphatase [Desulforhopalus singaporensis]
MTKVETMMNYILVLVAADRKSPLTESHLDLAGTMLGVDVLKTTWLRQGKAADLVLARKPGPDARLRLEKLLEPDRIDYFIIADDGARKKKLLVSDMDNTVVVGETLDDLAAACGLKEEISQITDRAMRGELDFRAALRSRVAMLKGLNEAALGTTCDAIRCMPGASTLVRSMQQAGAFCVLVSGGFTCFTEPVAKKLGFDVQHGNRLELDNGVLTGKVLEPVIDHKSKLQFLKHYMEARALDQSSTIAIGDGANDLAMLLAAGLGVGFHPKPYLKERIENNILYGDLTALLFVQGYTSF